MKKFLTLGVLALTLAVLTGQRASAWGVLKINIGLNVHWEGADNSILWGLIRTGPAPPGYIPGGAPYIPGGPLGPMPPVAYPHGLSMSLGQTPATQQKAPATAVRSGSLYQPVGYAVPSYGSYYYPSTPDSGAPQAPAYWYRQ